MQSPEFNKLMEGQPAKMLTLMKNQVPTAQDFTNAIPVPESMCKAVNDYILKLRNEKVKERTIRRLVARKFKITIVQ